MQEKKKKRSKLTCLLTETLDIFALPGGNSRPFCALKAHKPER